MSIEKLSFTADVEQINKDLEEILKVADWGERGQIGLTHRKGAKNLYTDAVGSLYKDGVKMVDESEFTEINESMPFYTNLILKEFAKFQRIKLGRIRFMRLLPNHGLSIHRDETERYHLVVKTNVNALFGFRTFKEGAVAHCYHMPQDNHFYKVDTTKFHFVYNGGQTERIHIVIVPRR